MLNHRFSKFYQSSRGRCGGGGGGALRVTVCEWAVYRVQYPIYCIFMLSAVMRGASVCDLIDGVSNS